MSDNEREIVPGLTSTDVREIADQVFNRTDGNHPQLSTLSGRAALENGFINILQNGKSDISASHIFVRKASL